MAEDLIVTGQWTIPGTELRERFSRSSGPGGQKINTSDSRVELSFNVSESATLPSSLRERVLARLAPRLVHGYLNVVASEHRSQLANRTAARQRMAHLLREACAPPRPQRRPTKATAGSRQRRLSTKRRRGEVKRRRGRPSPEDY